MTAEQTGAPGAPGAPAEPVPTPPAPVVPAAGPALPSFSFRELTEEEDPVVPFLFQGKEFHLRPKRINALVAMDVSSIKISMDSAPMWDLLRGLLADEYDEFRVMVRNPRLIIDAEKFNGLIEWMVVQAGARPT